MSNAAAKVEALHFPHRHLLTVEGLGATEINFLLDLADSAADDNRQAGKRRDILRGRTLINLFFEASTRTQSSFEMAAKRLGGDVLNMNVSTSSVQKGETLIDTAMTLNAMRPDIIVVRHHAAGAVELLAQKVDCSVVNAGDGSHQHPTQALLDLYTLREAFGRLDGLHVAIVGDVAHSRVARSLVQALRLVGSDAILVGPPTLVPSGLAPVSHDITSIADSDVIYVLRMQKERMLPGASFVPSLREYTARWGITPDRVGAGQRVMHPGPMNRGVELDSRVADSPASLISDQVHAGLVVRMAVLYDLLTAGPVAVESAVGVA
jgi:aspartate carbamoyltransferase catalytic subunit